MVDGEVTAGFEAVRDELDAVVSSQGRGGASLCAIVDGQVVVDLWGGTVAEDSLVHTWSVVKPVTAACLLLLIERGHLALHTPVEAVWPELVVAEGGGMVVADVLGHRAGLVTVPGGSLAGLTSWDRTCRALEVTAPAWTPGTAQGEHALTYGHLVGELVRRVDGRSLGRFLAEELAGPLDLDVHVGLEPRQRARVAPLDGPLEPWWTEIAGPPGTLRSVALGEMDEPLGGSSGSGELVNSDEWRAAEIPAVNGHATARGMARFWHHSRAGTLGVDLVQAPHTGPDLVLGREVTWTVGSVQVDQDDIGMGGVGGSYAGTKPSVGLAWAFLTTVMADHHRAERLESALVRCVHAR